MGRKRKLYEVYDGDNVVWRGNMTYIGYQLDISEKQIWWYVTKKKLYKKHYRINFVGYEEDPPKKKIEPVNEDDYIYWHLMYDKNVLVSEKGYEKNIDRIRQMYGEVHEKKILNCDGEEKRRKKKTYHYILEVGL